jgi:hypothetical protein
VRRAANPLLLVFVLAVSAPAQQRLLWRDPGNVAAVDLAGGIAPGLSNPKPPFTFVREDTGGTQPKLYVREAAGVLWDVKFGYEVKPESFSWRIPRAIGYFVEPSFYVAEGIFQNMGTLTRGTPSVKPDGHFTAARFQYRDPAMKLTKESWTWTSNPFRNSPQLHGLEMLVMLASNWDNKDGRTGLDETNTLIFQTARNNHPVLLYSFSDWGSGMGAWGDKTGQTDWRCEDYTKQSASFVKGVNNKGRVEFGYEGHIRDGFQTDIRPSDVRWLMKYLGQITDAQLRAALKASGATEEEQSCFTSAIRGRMEALRRVAR